MKRFLLVFTLVVGLTLILGFAAQLERGQLEENGAPSIDEEAAFHVESNGAVHVDGKQFDSVTSYFTSSYFTEQGKRCKPAVSGLSKAASPGHSHAMGSTADCTLSCTTIKSEYWPTGTLTIPVAFHILHDNGTGDLPDAQIQRQVDILNEDYRAMSGTLGENGFDTKIQFVLAGITRHDNRLWHRDKKESEYKAQTGWDPNTYMNVWVNTASGYLGYAYLPQDAAGAAYDGITLNYLATGGRGDGSAPYNQGRTLVHEAGHYLGLLHTFQGGCTNSYCSGDLILDTNAEAAPYYYCGSYSSCGNADPTTNYMDYSEDLCMWEFTSEQSNRLVCSLVNYRPNLYY